MKPVRNMEGATKPLLCIVLLVVTGYVGYKFAVPYYKYSAFKSEAKEIVRVSPENIENIRAEIYESAKSYQIPIEEKDINVTKGDNTVRVVISWSSPVDLLGYYQKTLDFKIDFEE